MEDCQYLSTADKAQMKTLQKELSQLKAEHKAFASNKGSLTLQQKEEWRHNSHRTNQVFIEIKDLRLKNILEAAKG